MSGLFIGLVVFAAFLLGLRAGIAIGQRAERRRKGDLPRARA
ncbi:MAG: hypothetical protein ABSE49_20135 [Polyangiaceae bacterium]|jgi:hypothetical protein